MFVSLLSLNHNTSKLPLLLQQRSTNRSNTNSNPTIPTSRQISVSNVVATCLLLCSLFDCHVLSNRSSQSALLSTSGHFFAEAAFLSSDRNRFVAHHRHNSHQHPQPPQHQQHQQHQQQQGHWHTSGLSPSLSPIPLISPLKMTSSTKQKDDVLALRPANEDIHLVVDKENRPVMVSSVVEFLITCAIVPVWAVAVLPLAVVWQAGRFLITQTPPGVGRAPADNLDSGYVVKDADIIPRPKRKYDIVMLGATGFTGKLTVRHLVKTYGFDGKKGEPVRWAIAGRSQSKLDQVKRDVIEEFASAGDDKQKLFDAIDTILVDTTVPAMLPNLVRDAKAIVTTAGPFHLYSVHVVEFCAKFGTHYVDISAELDWFRNMMVTWGPTAKKTGARIVTLCGCDSVPWDLSTMRMQDEIKKASNGQEELVSIQCFNEVNGGISGGTLYTCSLLIDGSCQKPPKVDPFLKTAKGTPSMAQTTLDPLAFIPSPIAFPWKPNAPALSMWRSPFLMTAVNCDAVKWSQALRGATQPLVYSDFMTTTSMPTALTGGIGIMMAAVALLNPITKYLLETFVFPKPGEGPDKKTMIEKSFLSVYSKGVGSKGSEYESVIFFKGDAGYIETARMVSEAGLSMALQEDELPAHGGGFYTPAIAMGDVYLKRLMATGTHYALKKTK